MISSPLFRVGDNVTLDCIAQTKVVITVAFDDGYNVRVQSVHPNEDVISHLNWYHQEIKESRRLQPFLRWL